jgi:hypothetical protein
VTRLERIFWGAAILLLPFIFSSGAGEQMREPKARFLILLMGLFLSLKVGERISWSLGGAASVVYLYAFFLCVGDFPYDGLLTFSAALGSCLLVAQAREDDVKRGLELLELVGIACAAYAMILQLKHHDPFMTLIPGADYHRVQVFFGQHTLYGPFAVAVAAIALFRERYLRAAFLFSPIVPIDASFTYLSAAVVITLFLLYRFGGKAVLGLSLMAVFSVGFATYHYAKNDFLKYELLDDNGRFALWHVTARIAYSHPLLGHGGIGSFASQFPIFQSKDLRAKYGIDDSAYSPEAKKLLDEAEYLRQRSGWFLSAHNEFLQAFYEFGAVGVFFALLLVGTFVWWWVIMPSDSPEAWALGAIFFSFMVNSLGNFPLHLIPQALLPLWAYTLVTTARDRGILEA